MKLVGDLEESDVLETMKSFFFTERWMFKYSDHTQHYLPIYTCDIEFV